MARAVGRGKGSDGMGVERDKSLANITKFMKSMFNFKNGLAGGGDLRGKRTGVRVKTGALKRRSNGEADVNSFWDCAHLGGDGEGSSRRGSMQSSVMTEITDDASLSSGAENLLPRDIGETIASGNYQVDSEEESPTEEELMSEEEEQGAATPAPPASRRRSTPLSHRKGSYSDEESAVDFTAPSPAIMANSLARQKGSTSSRPYSREREARAEEEDDGSGSVSEVEGDSDVNMEGDGGDYPSFGGDDDPHSESEDFSDDGVESGSIPSSALSRRSAASSRKGQVSGRDSERQESEEEDEYESGSEEETERMRRPSLRSVNSTPASSRLSSASSGAQRGASASSKGASSYSSQSKSSRLSLASSSGGENDAEEDEEELQREPTSFKRESVISQLSFTSSRGSGGVESESDKESQPRSTPVRSLSQSSRRSVASSRVEDFSDNYDDDEESQQPLSVQSKAPSSRFSDSSSRGAKYYGKDSQELLAQSAKSKSASSGRGSASARSSIATGTVQDEKEEEDASRHWKSKKSRGSISRLSSVSSEASTPSGPLEATPAKEANVSSGFPSSLGLRTPQAATDDYYPPVNEEFDYAESESESESEVHRDSPAHVPSATHPKSGKKPPLSPPTPVESESESEQEVRRDSPAPSAQRKKSGKKKQALSPSTPAAVARAPKAARKISPGVDENGRRIMSLTDLDDRPPPTPGVRRSGRTVIKPIKWWKNEHMIYDNKNRMSAEELPMAVGIELGPPTPAPKKRSVSRRPKRPGEVEPLDESQLTPVRGKRMREEEMCNVWDEEEARCETKHIVKRTTTRSFKKLKASYPRLPGHDGTGNAAQCFNVPQSSDICRWLSGSLKLPPGSIKDAEHVAVSTQLYWIMSGQPMSLELAVALPDDSSTTAEFDAETAQRYILSPGDHFYIPSNNVYRLENLSKTTECEISWVILRPFEDS